MADYGVMVIGAGPGGYVCAIRAAQLGKKTAIVERKWLGGVCLNVGCIPTKALLRNAEIAHLLRDGGKEFGFEIQDLRLDFSIAVQRSRRVADRLTKGVGFLMRKNQIDVHMGSAVFADANTITVTNEDGDTKKLTAKDIVIATGASPLKIPGVEVDGERVITYEEAILQEQLPKSVVIIGAGPIGLEFATIWNRYGVDVTLVEMLPRIAPLEDEEISEELAKAFNKQGIRILTNTKVIGTEALKTKVKVNVSSPDGDQTMDAEQVLVAVGFKANTVGLDLEGVGVQLDDGGVIGIDDRMATNIPGVWAIGDVTGKLMLAHVATTMGIVCAENIAGVETMKLNYEMLPRGTFCQPQIASFGLTEAQARERGHEVTLGRFPFRASGKALGMGDYDGWVKLVVDAKYGEILGAHLIGPEVTELLAEISLAQLMELTPAEIARNVHIHPTLSEVIMEAAHDAEGHPIHI